MTHLSSQRPSWDEYFAEIAKTVSTRADCRRRQVGAVIVDREHRILSTGYNGAPPNKPGCLLGACPRGMMTYEELQAFTAYDSCISIHAEANALLFARTNLVGASIYVTCRPCNDCAKLIAGAGIVRTIFPLEESSVKRNTTSTTETAVPVGDGFGYPHTDGREFAC